MIVFFLCRFGIALIKILFRILYFLNLDEERFVHLLLFTELFEEFHFTVNFFPQVVDVVVFEDVEFPFSHRSTLVENFLEFLKFCHNFADDVGF